MTDPEPPDYIRAAGEVLSYTEDGGKAFDVYCGLRKVRPAYGRPEQARYEMQETLTGTYPLTVENCARAFEQALFRHHLTEWAPDDD